VKRPRPRSPSSRTDVSSTCCSKRAAVSTTHFEEISRSRRSESERSARYDPWLSRPLNNADLAAVADYESLVPAFRRLFEQVGGFPELYRAVEELARLDAEERVARLEALRGDEAVVTVAAPCPVPP
jgi:predicted aminopeptidase